jgi:hypothetical protein
MRAQFALFTTYLLFIVGVFIMDLLEHEWNNMQVQADATVIQSAVQESNWWVSGFSGKAYLLSNNRLNTQTWQRLNALVNPKAGETTQADQLDQLR